MNETPPNVLKEDFTLLAPEQLPSQAMAATQHVLTQSQYFAIAAVAAALLLFLLWWMRRRVRARRTAEAAHVIALRELFVWRELADETRYREAVAAISATLRRYVEQRYGLRASSATTEEFWQAQRMSRRIPHIYAPFWERFTSAGDLIKYAGLTPRQEEFQQLFADSVQFVEASHVQSRSRPEHE